MDFDRYFGLSTSSKNHQSAIKSQFDMCIDFDEIEDDDEEVKGEYPCPFCSEEFDLLVLDCHIDEDHPSEVCPLCHVRVGMNIVGHIGHIMETFLISRHKLKLNKGESHSTFLTLRKELQNRHFQSLLARSPSSVSSSRMASDPLLSFVYNTPAADVSESVETDSSTGKNAEEETSYKKTLETNVIQSSLSDKDHVEKAKRCELQGLMLSTIFDDDL